MHKFLVTAQYIAAWLVMAVTLLAHWLYLLNEAGMIQLHLSESVLGFIVLHRLGWIIPLVYLLVLNKVVRQESLVSTKIIILLLIAPTLNIFVRLCSYLFAHTLVIFEISWVYAIIQLILLAVYTVSLCKQLFERRKIKE